MSPVKRGLDAHTDDGPVKRLKTAGTCILSIKFYTTPIILNVDESPHNFHCHEELIQSKAKRLYEACKVSNGTPEQSPILHVPDIDARLMNIFLVWLYTGQITRPFDDDTLPGVVCSTVRGHRADAGEEDRLYVGPSPSFRQGVTFLDDIEIVELFIFAQRYSVSGLEEEALSALATSAILNDRSAAANAVNKAYTELERYSGLPSYLVEHAYTTIRSASFSKTASAFCADYIGDVLSLFLDHPMSWESDRSERLAAIEGYAIHDIWTHEDDQIVCSVSPFALMNSEMSVLLVGTERQPFLIHKNFLCHCSEYFKSALDGNFSEAASGQLCLDHEEIRTFNQFLEWMYEGKIRIPARHSYSSIRSHSRQPANEHKDASATHGQIYDDIDDTDGAEYLPEAEEGQEWEQLNLIELYIFADRRDIPALRNDVITELIALSEVMDEHGRGWYLTSTYFHHVRLACDNLPADSTLIRYLIAETVWFWRAHEYADEELHTLPPEFLIGVLREEYKVRKKRAAGWKKCAPWREELCSLHEHNDEQRAPSLACTIKHQELQNELKQKIVHPVAR